MELVEITETVVEATGKGRQFNTVILLVFIRYHMLLTSCFHILQEMTLTLCGRTVILPLSVINVSVTTGQNFTPIGLITGIRGGLG